MAIGIYSSVGLGITQRPISPKSPALRPEGFAPIYPPNGPYPHCDNVPARRFGSSGCSGRCPWPAAFFPTRSKRSKTVTLSSALLCSRQRSCKAGRAAADDDDLSVFAHNVSPFPHANRGFTWFNVLKALCASTGACALHTCSRASGGLRVVIPHPPAGFIRSFSNHLTNFVSTCYNKAMATAGCRKWNTQLVAPRPRFC